LRLTSILACEGITAFTKLLCDPQLDPAYQVPVYRFDGIVEDGVSDLDPVVDPRPQLSFALCRKKTLDLPVPSFKFDQYYVGERPIKEVTFSNLNDNISYKNLEHMCKQFGIIEETKIYYHPKTQKHLGIGKVVFKSSRNARTCAEMLNQTSKMGNIMTVQVDPMGLIRRDLVYGQLQDLFPNGQPPLNTALVSYQEHSAFSISADQSYERNLSYTHNLPIPSQFQSEITFPHSIPNSQTLPSVYPSLSRDRESLMHKNYGSAAESLHGIKQDYYQHHELLEHVGSSKLASTSLDSRLKLKPITSRQHVSYTHGGMASLNGANLVGEESLEARIQKLLKPAISKTSGNISPQHQGRSNFRSVHSLANEAVEPEISKRSTFRADNRLRFSAHSSANLPISNKDDFKTSSHQTSSKLQFNSSDNQSSFRVNKPDNSHSHARSCSNSCALGKGNGHIAIQESNSAIDQQGNSTLPNRRTLLPTPPENASNYSTNSIHNYRAPLLQTPRQLSDDALDKYTDLILDSFINELKSVLHRDIARRLVEGNAFRAFTTWWETCELGLRVSSKVSAQNKIEVQSLHQCKPSSHFSNALGLTSDALGNSNESKEVLIEKNESSRLFAEGIDKSCSRIFSETDALTISKASDTLNLSSITQSSALSGANGQAQFPILGMFGLGMFTGLRSALPKIRRKPKPPSPKIEEAEDDEVQEDRWNETTRDYGLDPSTRLDSHASSVHGSESDSECAHSGFPGPFWKSRKSRRSIKKWSRHRISKPVLRSGRRGRERSALVQDCLTSEDDLFEAKRVSSLWSEDIKSATPRDRKASFHSKRRQAAPAHSQDESDEQLVGEHAHGASSSPSLTSPASGNDDRRGKTSPSIHQSNLISKKRRSHSFRRCLVRDVFEENDLKSSTFLDAKYVDLDSYYLILGERAT
ncbi:unnamed protein product, partial [Protopolystoma xenopodis]